MLVCIFIARPRNHRGLVWSQVRSGPQDEEAIKEGGVDSIAVSLFGNITVETGEIHIITKEYQNKRSK